MEYRYKVVLLAVVPLLLATGFLGAVVWRERDDLVAREVAAVDAVLLDGKRQELSNYFDMARSAIANFYDSGRDDEGTKLHSVQSTPGTHTGRASRNPC